MGEAGGKYYRCALFFVSIPLTVVALAGVDTKNSSAPRERSAGGPEPRGSSGGTWRPPQVWPHLAAGYGRRAGRATLGLHPAGTLY